MILNNYDNVTIIDPSNTYISSLVTIQSGSVIYPFVTICGNTHIGANTTIYSHCFINNATIGDNCNIYSSHIVDSAISNNCQVGPNATLRAAAHIGDNCRIGNFVEVKNSSIGDNTKAAHLSYIGDASIGKHCNIGCGVVFANYDGKVKHHTNVGDNCFVGCNSSLIAPLNVGDNCYIACGSVITDNLAPRDFAIARARQVTKSNYSQKYI